MTDQKINVAIAEACGWRPRHHCNGFYREGHDGWIEQLPSYCSDLNAMHEAEKVLPYEKLGDYLNRLVELTGYCDTKTWTQANFDLNTATARQRAEAFLRTLGKWEAGT
jgi:hypothetical protein